MIWDYGNLRTHIISSRMCRSCLLCKKQKRNEDALIEARRNFGRFVLASNQVDLDPEVMLNYYKGQQAVERGFRFLKDKSFHVSEVYLKKEERIEALCMIMVLSLLIYSFAEWKLRQELKEKKQTVPNQLNKPTQRLLCAGSLRSLWAWLYRLLRMEELSLKTIVHLSDPQITILELLGSECKKYYGMEWTAECGVYNSRRIAFTPASYPGKNVVKTENPIAILPPPWLLQRRHWLRLSFQGLWEHCLCCSRLWLSLDLAW